MKTFAELTLSGPNLEYNADPYCRDLSGKKT